MLQRFVAVAGPKASENDAIQTSPLTAFIILKGGTREKLPPRTDMRSQQPFILSRGRGVRLEFYPGCFLSCLSTLRRNPLLSESDRRGFSPKITNAPPPTFDSWEATGGAGGRGRGLELINANSGVPFSNDHQGLFFAHRLVHRGGGRGALCQIHTCFRTCLKYSQEEDGS